MGTIRAGYLNKYERDMEKLCSTKADFQVISSGLTRKIVFPDRDDEKQKRLYFGHKKSDILPGVYMVNAVRRNIDSYIEKGGEIPVVGTRDSGAGGPGEIKFRYIRRNA